uniref:WAP domain-containing protein n=1 Tax=Trichuris muris TaxID=70415 RepID=A0A5S6Q0C3_TRIMR
MKCCLTIVDYECTEPDGYSSTFEKQGLCPRTPPLAGTARFCEGNSPCIGAKNCCLTKVGYQCTNPVNEPTQVTKRGPCPSPPPSTGKLAMSAYQLYVLLH